MICSKSTSVVASLFGTLSMESSFPNDQSKGKDLVSLVFFVANILVLPLLIFIGHASDRVKIWKLHLAINIIVIAFVYLFILNIQTPNFW
jgi:Ca2+/H+ antiporter